ncbi:MAG: tetratricopeptide repeat protein [Verrucomicrobiales bacterium]|nr:tetratricopeptide repeat protein [Verrucomicrobiales bacterium]
MPTVRTPSPGAVAGELYADIKDKDETIAFLNKENLELRKELSQRKTVLETVQKQLADAQGERNRLLQQIAQAERNGGGLAAQQKVEQLKQLLRDATEQLQNATDRNAKLVNALAQSQRESEKLRDRLAEVERERDNLAEVVRGDGNGGRALKELMDRNRELASQLDRAEQLAESLSELSKEKDQDIKMLKSEISRIKLERDRLLSENLRHQQSIENLQRKLELLSDGLSAEEKTALASASPVERQENELLRSIVLKQLRRQAQMKQAKELLLKQLDKLGSRSDTLFSLVEDIATGSQLTEEEKALFKTPQLKEIVDAATAMPPSSTKSASGPSMSATLIGAAIGGGRKKSVVKDQKLSVELSQLDKSARLDFKEGRYAEAETGFLEYLRYRPRSVSCLCNLGVLKIALKNFSDAEYYLEKALAVDGDSGLAHYLLGRTYYLQGKLDDALERLETSLTHDPQNAKAHNTVGVISSQKGWVARAERAFTNAVSIDPEFGDAHFNLAVLYATREEPDPKATDKHYNEARRLGVPPDETIEDFLQQAKSAGATLGARY